MKSGLQLFLYLEVSLLLLGALVCESTDNDDYNGPSTNPSGHSNITTTSIPKQHNEEAEEALLLRKAQDTSQPYIPVSPKFNLHLPPGYSKLIIPSEDTNFTTTLNITLFVHEVVDVNLKNEEVKLDVDLIFEWVDIKIRDHILRHKVLWDKFSNGTFLPLDADILKIIWHPDVSFDESLESVGPSCNDKMSLKVYLSENTSDYLARFELRTRETVNLRCDMDFRFYPADTQKCRFNLVSDNFQFYDLSLAWTNSTTFEGVEIGAVYLNNADDPNFQFQISHVKPDKPDSWYSLEIKGDGTYSALTFTLQIRRNLSYHLLQSYLPSVLLVSITCLSFLLPPDMVEARIGISMTTLLTLTAMFSSIREKSPEVSYTMAIDIWIVFCIFIVFLALLLFAVIYWTRRKLIQLAESQPKKMKGENKEEGGGDDGGKNLKAVGRRLTLPLNYEVNKGEEHLSDRSRKTKVLKARKARCYGRLVNASRRYSFLAFTFIFITFLVVYSSWLLICSKHFIWAPDPKYNYNPDDDDEMETKKPYKFSLFHRINSTVEKDLDWNRKD